MASLNDIENQLDIVIDNLAGGLSNSIIYDVNVEAGAYTLTDSKTFTDIKASLTAGKMPIIRYIDDTTTYFFMPSISATADVATLSWYMLRPIIDGENVSTRIVTIRENTETTNKFISYTNDIDN